MKWYNIFFNRFKNHIVSENLKDTIVEDITNRGSNDNFSKEVESYLIDLPGMILVDRQIYDIILPGVCIKVPATDVKYFLSKVTSLPLREISNVKYYKLHANYGCLCMTPYEKNLFEKQLYFYYEEAQKQSEAENIKLKKALENINKYNG